MNKSFIVGITVLFVFGFALNDVLSTNITIYDGSGTGTGWHGAGEDQEVEPGCVGDQVWDLEAFLLDGSTLTMVGGFDFKDGVPNYNGLDNSFYDFTSGDIFIDVDDTAGNNTVGYEYAIDLDFANNAYHVYSANADSTVQNVYYTQNAHSNPWQIADNWTHSTGLDGDMIFHDGDYSTGFLGDIHYAVELTGLDSEFIKAGNTFHFTMGCGNDNLMGQVAPVPEPSTLLLLGFGLFGFAARKRGKK